MSWKPDSVTWSSARRSNTYPPPGVGGAAEDGGRWTTAVAAAPEARWAASSTGRSTVGMAVPSATTSEAEPARRPASRTQPAAPRGVASR